MVHPANLPSRHISDTLTLTPAEIEVLLRLLLQPSVYLSPGEAALAALQRLQTIGFVWQRESAYFLSPLVSEDWLRQELLRHYYEVSNWPYNTIQAVRLADLPVSGWREVQHLMAIRLTDDDTTDFQGFNQRVTFHARFLYFINAGRFSRWQLVSVTDAATVWQAPHAANEIVTVTDDAQGVRYE
jgi:hypothetical protein